MTPRKHPAIAVDGGVVKCGGRPIYVLVAVDAYTKQPICLVLVYHSPAGGDHVTRLAETDAYQRTNTKDN